MCLKKFLVMVMIVVCCVNLFPMSASAENFDIFIEDEIIDEYQIAARIDSVLGISGNVATYVSSGNSVSGTITVEHTLQKHWGLWIWDDVAGSTYSKSVNVNFIDFCSTKSGLDSGTYRVKSTFMMTNSAGQTETITIYSSEKTVS